MPEEVQVQEQQIDLSLQDLFRIRDALTILDGYGMVDELLKQEVNQEIAKRRDGDSR